MGVEPPFLYDKPSKYSFVGPTDRPFNPKAVSQSSLTPTATRPKPQGPLINSKELNRHPDSYFIVPYGQLDWKPLSPTTKTKVKWIRWVQLLLRICALLGACGLLVCVICIKGTESTTGWIIRVAPGIAILHTMYAVYHLIRSSKGRTPASSASYMLFAAMFDAGLIPFYVFTALISHQQYYEPSVAPGRWQTLFEDDPKTQKIIYSTYLIGVTAGGIHLVSLCVSIYLAFIFRKIARLPPDMNPLEDNLTSRHKRNKSSLSATATEINNRDSHLSAPLIDAPRMVPFMHTRTDSNSVSPQRRPVHSHQNSRTDLPLYQQPRSQRSSRADILPSPERSPKRNLQYSDPRPTSTRPNSTHSSLNDNWVSYPSQSPSPPTAGPPEFQHLRTIQNLPNPTLPQPQVNKYDFSNRTPRPLEMNPPTPPITSYYGNRGEDRALAPMPANAVWYEDPNTPQRPQQQPQHGRGDSYGGVRDKMRYYGNLHAGKGRVVSSGAKVDERSGMRAREVSGKVAEEGRAFRY
ncbi:hypothetical protein MMC30_008611 [Trapelia coarctata]|nr:hypothetical protein [Trapelia coarctata]